MNGHFNKVALFIGAHVEEIEAEIPLLPLYLAQLNWRVVILNPIGGWNWLRLRKLNSQQLNEFKQSCYKAATVLGAEKIILDYDIGALPDCRYALKKEMAQIIYDLSPSLIFIPWIRDTHQDHRYLANLSFELLRERHFITLTKGNGEKVKDKNYEIWAYPAGISQTYDFWPDAVFIGDKKMFKQVEEADNAFAYIGKEKIRSFIDNVKRKTHYWSVFSKGKPAEALKFAGPYFPLNGTLLKHVLNEHLLPVESGPVLCCKEYIE